MLKSPPAKPRSRAGNHSAVAFMPAGLAEPSAKPSSPRSPASGTATAAPSTPAGLTIRGEKGDSSFLSRIFGSLLAGAALVFAIGAQGTKWLGLPGEDLRGVYHAKDLVYHYNRLPPFSERHFPMGRRVAIVGVGNVMVDIANYCVHFCDCDAVIAVGGYSFVVSFILGKAIDKTIGFRISEDDEVQGVDMTAHAETAYEFGSLGGTLTGAARALSMSGTTERKVDA